jgi:anti-anti-sigma factor
MIDSLKIELSTTSLGESKEKIYILSLTGMLDGHATISVEKRLTDHGMLQKPTKLVIDLEGLTYISSAGIGLLLATRARLIEHAGVCEICCAGPAVMEIFQIVGIIDLVGIHASRKEAVQAAATS